MDQILCPSMRMSTLPGRAEFAASKTISLLVATTVPLKTLLASSLRSLSERSDRHWVRHESSRFMRECKLTPDPTTRPSGFVSLDG